MELHRSFGVTALVLGLFRILWMLKSARPSLPGHMNDFDVKSSRASHIIIYILAILVPITGYLTTVSFATTFYWFNLFTVPALITEAKNIVPYFYHSHWILYHLLLIIVVLHVGAAIWHHFSKQDTVLKRMLPGYYDQS